jgi:hypothetical protein
MSVALVAAAIKTQISTEPSGTSFRESVGDRYYHQVVPDNTTLPCAVYAVEPEPWQYDYGGTRTERYAVPFSVWVSRDTSDDAAALAIADKLVARMNRVTLTVSGFDRMFVRGVRQCAITIDGDAYRVDGAFEATGQRTS